ncbi:MAG: cupin domain-containing protein, partial [Terriglobales bacterium]
REPAPMDLAWLLAPTLPDAFFAQYWERQPLILRRSRPEYFRGLLSLTALEQALAKQTRQYPEVMLKDASRELDAADYTSDGVTLDLRRVYELFAAGATISVAFLDTVWPPLGALCRALESDWTCPFQANVYLTPPAAQGAKPHYDTHDVFVLQVEGSKQWRLFGSPLPVPLAGQEFDPGQHALGPVTAEFEMHAGDVAYIPRGVAHEARATRELSLHITLGALRYTWADALLEMVAAACIADPAFRYSLPRDFARADTSAGAAAQLRALLHRIATEGPAEAALSTLRADFLASRPPDLPGQLEQIAALPRLQGASRIQRRPGAEVSVRQESDDGVILSGNRTIRLPAYALPAAARALAGAAVRVAELPGLDADGQLTLARRLIREGLLVQIVPAAATDPPPSAPLAPTAAHGVI